jgi:hypothetical protein
MCIACREHCSQPVGRAVLLCPAVLCEQALAPDVEFILSRAQTIKQEAAAPLLTADHLNKALSSLPGARCGGGALPGEACPGWLCGSRRVRDARGRP